MVDNVSRRVGAHGRRVIVARREARFHICGREHTNVCRTAQQREQDKISRADDAVLSSVVVLQEFGRASLDKNGDELMRVAARTTNVTRERRRDADAL
jgi:hypothetical protein